MTLEWEAPGLPDLQVQVSRGGSQNPRPVHRLRPADAGFDKRHQDLPFLSPEFPGCRSGKLDLDPAGFKIRGDIVPFGTVILFVLVHRRQCGCPRGVILARRLLMQGCHPVHAIPDFKRILARSILMQLRCGYDAAHAVPDFKGILARSVLMQLRCGCDAFTLYPTLRGSCPGAC